MHKAKSYLLAALGLAALAGPAAATDRDFQFRAGDITGEGGKLDKRSGQQWVPIISWEWRRYVTADGTFKTDAKLEKQGFYDTGSILVNGQFEGCEKGKAIPEAVLKTPGVRYTFSDLVVVVCDVDNMTLNYGKIRSSASW
jgi:hypothetical protein